MKKKQAYFFVLFILVTTYINKSYAQAKPATSAINGRIISADNAPVKDVLVQLRQATDKKLLKMEYTDSTGNFRFDKIPDGNYQVTTQSMLFTPYESATFRHEGSTRLAAISLQLQSKQLKEATVTASKPFVQQQYDKTVINVASSISAAGSTALEVLEKSPGITIDQNDNIAMRGRQGVLVMIDGKQVPMSGPELATMLRSMSANQIETIDLITNPSSKYDAAGNAGIIDIRLKKDNKSGTNGNISLSYGQGKYPKVNPALTFNSKYHRLNIFGAYNYNYRQELNALTIYRQFYNADNQYTGGTNYDNRFRFNAGSHNARIGADYNISKNIVAGFVANGIFNNMRIFTNSPAQSLDAAGQPAGTFITTGTNTPRRNNRSINFNYKHTLDTSGRQLTADLDYARFNASQAQYYTTRFFDNHQLENKSPYELFGDLQGDLSIRSVKADYTQRLKALGARLDAGVKSSWIKTDNDVRFFDRSNGGNVLDKGKSNRFIYKENINAAYINVAKKWKRWDTQLGLRVENTNADGLQVTDSTAFTRHYTQLFPSGYLGYAINANNDLGITVSRRIERPSYRQLNPFKIFLDPYTYEAGNPYLLPELTTSTELTYTFKQQYTAKIGYSRTKDNIIEVLSPDTVAGSVIQTGRNLAVYDYYNMSVSFPASIAKWLSSTNTVLVFYGRYKGNLVNTHLDVSRVAVELNSVNTVTINPLTSLEITGSYNSRSYYGFLDVKGYWFMNIGAQRQLWNRKASVKLNVSDIFLTNQTNAVTRLAGYGETFHQRRDTRVMTFTFNYRFGSNGGNSNARKTGGAEEEKRRAG
ncbi:outer membrane receptor protein involved in Fe transport [Chitinophaga polysaccharea]|uniref:Outer membrane receptor protein involved in Fe transport n=1 Tax=Chitinophaga polysaccharea TaxID=1293035 RepID=A0A561PXF8_9BACT|nr:outer membrane beta-barrel protein [Chitinophaga polysaccharea]TWF42800.1 outer membrane receptor protein involved in Fe transport [Chitinophaga polysaccharea]